MAHARVQDKLFTEPHLVLQVDGGLPLGMGDVEIELVWVDVVVRHLPLAVARVFRAGDDLVAGQGAADGAHLRAAAEAFGRVDAVRRARAGRLGDVDGPVAVARHAHAGEQVERLRDGAVPGQGGARVFVQRPAARIVELLAVGGRRDAFRAAAEIGLGHGAARAQFREQPVVAVVVDPPGDAVADRIVEFGKIQVASRAVVRRRGQQQLGAARRPAAVRVADFAAPAREPADADGLPLEGRAVFRDHVHHAEERAAAVDGGAGAGHEFDAVDEGQVDGEFGADGALVVDDVVQAPAVDQDQQPRVQVARIAQAADVRVVVVAVVGHRHAGHALQDLRERAVAALADVLGRDHGDGRRCLADLLRNLRRRDDLEVEQLFEGQGVQIGTLLRQRAGLEASRKEADGTRQATERRRFLVRQHGRSLRKCLAKRPSGPV